MYECEIIRSFSSLLQKGLAVSRGFVKMALKVFALYKKMYIERSRSKHSFWEILKKKIVNFIMPEIYQWIIV